MNATAMVCSAVAGSIAPAGRAMRAKTVEVAIPRAQQVQIPD